MQVAELFAGVGGFRLGLEAANKSLFKTVFANQWEPPGKETKQFAWRCYESHFGAGSCINEDIALVLDEVESQKRKLPKIDMVTAGFPCQDYSVAKPNTKSSGLVGKKGVLWWQIYRFLKLAKPTYCLFENVDRLLKSPSNCRGRDFAIMLSCLHRLGYTVEWQVVCASDYGFPQKRRRVFIFAYRDVFLDQRVISKALPIKDDTSLPDFFFIDKNPYKEQQKYEPNRDGKSRFKASGMMPLTGQVLTYDYEPVFDGEIKTLGDIVLPKDSDKILSSVWLNQQQIDRALNARASKRILRTAKTGHTYWYSEGAMAFPDPLDKPARTILTSEGGTPSRMTHVIEQGGKYRKLVPEEMEMLQGFPVGWTDTGMTARQRAFCMGNALVVSIVEKIGRQLANVGKMP